MKALHSDADIETFAQIVKALHQHKKQIFSM